MPSSSLTYDPILLAELDNHSTIHRLPPGWPNIARMSDPNQNEAEKNIERWKVQKLIKRLEAARGNGTSMISLIIRGYTIAHLCFRC